MVSFISGFFNSKERTLKDFQLLHNLVEKHPESKLADKIKSIASSNVKLLEKFNGYVKQWDKLGLCKNWLRVSRRIGGDRKSQPIHAVNWMEVKALRSEFVRKLIKQPCAAIL